MCCGEDNQRLHFKGVKLSACLQRSSRCLQIWFLLHAWYFMEPLNMLMGMWAFLCLYVPLSAFIRCIMRRTCVVQSCGSSHDLFQPSFRSERLMRFL